MAHAHTHTHTRSFPLVLTTTIVQDMFGGKSVGAKYLRGTTRLWDEDEKELVDVWENYSKTHVGELSVSLVLCMSLLLSHSLSIYIGILIHTLQNYSMYRS